MLSKTFEWYRMVNVKPDDATIESRKAAVADLIKILTKSTDLQLSSISAVVNGFEASFSDDSELVQAVVKCIRDHQAAFPGSLSENYLELRACVSIALGEIIGRHFDGDKSPDDNAQIVSCCLVPSLEMRSKNKQKYIQLVLDELNATAQTTIEKSAKIKRQRQDLNFKNFEKVEVADLTTFWSKLQPALKAYLSGLSQQAQVDREELNVLWWLYNGFSESENKPLSEIPVASAAVYCGSELAGKVAVPPLNSIKQMVTQSIRKDRKSAELTAQPLIKIVSSWTESAWKQLVPKNADIQKAVMDNPVIFPLSWVCARLQESKGTVGWKEEFKLKTGINPSQNVEPVQLSLQVFNELMAQKIYDESLS